MFKGSICPKSRMSGGERVAIVRPRAGWALHATCRYVPRAQAPQEAPAAPQARQCRRRRRLECRATTERRCTSAVAAQDFSSNRFVAPPNQMPRDDDDMIYIHGGGC